MKTAEEFVSKWSNWWITNNNKNVLNRAFENELKEIIEQAQKEAYTEGYNEAMRWRDPKDELPENEEIVQVKCHSNNETWYEQLRYMKAHNVWACDQTIGAKVVGWKPIE